MGDIVRLPARRYRTAQDARALIVAVAEERFRERGYANTTVREVALACGMSTANVHRLFPSKADLSRAVAERWAAEMHRIAREAISRPDQSVSRRLQDLATRLSTYVRASYVQHRKLHEVVAAVMAEHPEVVRRHVVNMEEVIRELLTSGVRSGEVAVEPVEDAAELVFAALARYTHPHLVAEWCERPLEEQAARTVRLLMSGLKGGLRFKRSADVSAASARTGRRSKHDG